MNTYCPIDDHHRISAFADTLSLRNAALREQFSDFILKLERDNENPLEESVQKLQDQKSATDISKSSSNNTFFGIFPIAYDGTHGWEIGLADQVELGKFSNL